MNEELIIELLDKLKTGQLSEITIKKEDFLVFREQLVRRSDFKHFQGIAKHGGVTIYKYLQEERS